MRAVLTVLALLALAGCGASGAPQPKGDTKPGLTVTGTAKIGVGGTF